MTEQEAIERLQAIYSNPQAKVLLKPEWKVLNVQSGIDATGFCYFSCQILYYLFSNTYKLKRGKCAGGSHYWLEQNGRVVDPTAAQLPKGYDYKLGKGTSFRSGRLSKESRALASLAGITLP